MIEKKNNEMRTFILMKFYILLFLLTSLINNTFSQNNNYFGLEEIAKSEAKAYHNKGLKGVPQAANYDLKYHRLEWQIDPEVYYIKGSVTSHFVPVVSGFNEIYFDFSTSLVFITNFDKLREKCLFE